MAEMIFADDIDFAQYEQETDAQAKVKPASQWIAELIERIQSSRQEPRCVMP